MIDKTNLARKLAKLYAVDPRSKHIGIDTDEKEGKEINRASLSFKKNSKCVRILSEIPKLLNWASRLKAIQLNTNAN